MAISFKTIDLASITTAYQASTFDGNVSITFLTDTACFAVLDVATSALAISAISAGNYVVIPANAAVRISSANPSRVWLNPTVITKKMSMILGD